MSSLLRQLRLASLPAGAQALRAEVKTFLASTLGAASSDVRARSWMGFDAGFSKALANHGWVGVTLPTEYGGSNLDAFPVMFWWKNCLPPGHL